jgi:hypothetical protein
MESTTSTDPKEKKHSSDLDGEKYQTRIREIISK